MRRFTDTFDDVIDTAVAIGTIGRGTASLALRGGVDVIRYSKGASASIIIVIKSSFT